MKHTFFRTLAVIIILFISTATWAQHIYVSPLGNDRSAGTQQAPFQTIKKAIEYTRQLPGNDTVYINISGGLYEIDEPIVLTEQDKRPIVFEGDANKMPIISGGYRISNWTITPEGWWKTYVPQVIKYGKHFEQLFVNGKRATLARTPNKGLFEVINRVHQTAIETEGKGEGYGYHIQRYDTDPANLISLKSINEGYWGDANLNNKDIRIKLYQAWDNTYKSVDYINPDSGYIYIHGTKLHDMYSNRNLFMLENYPEALDSPGEWFLSDKGELTYIPLQNEDPEKAIAYAPTLSNLLIIKGTQQNKVIGKIFKNLSFQHTAYYLPRKGTTPHQAATHLDGTVLIDNAEGIVIENCEIKHTGNYGVTFENTLNSKVEHTFLYDLGGGGIKIDDSDGIIIHNNIIRKGGQVFPAGVGVILRHSAKNKVIHNDICDLRYSGVSVGWIWGYGPNRSVENEIAYNHIHHLGWGELDDMGGVYTLGISPGTTVHNNLIHDIYSHDYGGWGLYTDEGSTGIIMENNLVYACKCGGFHQHYGKDNIIRNNILAWGTWHQMQWTRAEEHRSFIFAHNIVLSDGFPLASNQSTWEKGKADFDSNCFWDIVDPKPMFYNMPLTEFTKRFDRKTVHADPMFRDPLHGDFTFKNLKVARKIGFKPFDYSKAGVEGDASWKQKAQMKAEEIEDFKSIVREGEKKYCEKGSANYRPAVARNANNEGKIYPKYYE